MVLEEEIFEEFFKKLEVDNEVHEDIISELKRIIESGDIFDKEKILKAINSGAEF